MFRIIGPVLAAIGATLMVAVAAPASAEGPRDWQREFKKTDFSKHSIKFREIMSGGVRRDRIPAIDNPKFIPARQSRFLSRTDPVVGVIVNGEAKAYPLAILLWHEIVNDTVGGVPVTVTYCPLCNTSIAFDRRLDGKVLDFGTTGRLRNSDLVMYDRQTETWWQQFTGEGLIGELTGKFLKIVPARLESFEKFRARAPEGLVLIANDRGARAYGNTPYAGYDTSRRPFLYRGRLPTKVAPLSRVVRVGEQAWALDLVRGKKRLETPGGLILTWTAGQNSAMNERIVAQGADVGNVMVQRQGADGLVDVPYSVDFAFAFHAFYPESEIYTE